MRERSPRSVSAVSVCFAAALALFLPARAAPQSGNSPAAASTAAADPTGDAAAEAQYSAGNAAALVPPVSEDTGALPALPPAPDNFWDKFKEDLSKPLTPREKLKRATVRAIFPGIVASAAGAGLGMAVDTRLSRDYGMGARGFLRRWASGFGENAVGLFVGDYALASMLHQDPRYHPEKKRGFSRRLGHAIAAVFVTQTDSGAREFNASHLTGLVVGAGASTAWHRASDRGAGYFGERVGAALAGSIGYRIVEEFLFYRKEPRQ